MGIYILIGIALSILTLLSYILLRQRSIQTRQKAALQNVFGEWANAQPIIKRSSSHGWPTITLLFQSKADLDFALKNKLTEEFKNQIRSCYPAQWDADRAIYFSYKEQDQTAY